MFKVILSVIAPTSTLEAANIILSMYGDYQLSIQELPILLLSVLVTLIFVQFMLSKISLLLFLKKRTQLTDWLLEKPLCDHVPTHLHICLDRVPQGYDCIVKICEILLFYTLLIAIVFYLYPVLGILLLIIVPIFLFIMLVKGRKEVFVQTERNKTRKELISLEDDHQKAILLGNDGYRYGRNSIIYADALAGFSVVIMMLVFLYLNESDAQSFSGFTALALVFGIRFAIMYAGEFSRVLNRLLKQRITFREIIYSPFI